MSLARDADQPSLLFDEEWYLAEYPDVAEAGVAAWHHYSTFGVSEGRRPNRYFDPQWYLATYPDARSSGVDPLSHYLDIGCWQGLDPGPDFSTDAYLEAHPELRTGRVNPLAHALELGADARAGASPGMGRSREPALRPISERATPTGGPSTESVSAAIDHAYSVPGVGVFIIGWLLDPAQRVTEMKVRTKAGDSSNVLDSRIRIDRPDVVAEFPSKVSSHDGNGVGFAALARVKLTGGWPLDRAVLVLSASDGTELLVGLPDDRRRQLSVQGVIQDILRRVPLSSTDSLHRHLAPAITAIWAARPQYDRADQEIIMGTRPSDPDVSIIIPVYGRYDLVDYQLSQFAADPEVSNAEIIYVIDDPRIAQAAASLCSERHSLYRVPMRLILASRNRGFAGAINAGLARATARNVLLLNSDVMPVRPGWLGRLLEVQAGLPEYSLLAPRLLFPDGSIEHEGIEFAQTAGLPGIWINRHPGKGLPASSLEGERLLEVPAVSAACMVARREDIERLGGLSEDYVIGDFEDSDLCLKARGRGGRAYVAPWVELYHLERRSFSTMGSGSWRTRLTWCNAWRHTQKWGATIEAISGDTP